MSLSHGILGFLSYGNMSGYDLAKAFGSSIKFFWYAQTSHIYLELNKLEKKGLVTCEVIMQTDKPNKKLYSITESGKKEFLDWLASDKNEFEKGNKNAFLMRVFFSGNRTPKESIEMLSKYIEDCKTYLNSMKDIPESIKEYEEFTESYQSLYWSFTADFGYSYVKMSMEWAERCVQRLEEIK